MARLYPFAASLTSERLNRRGRLIQGAVSQHLAERLVEQPERRGRRGLRRRGRLRARALDLPCEAFLEALVAGRGGRGLAVAIDR